MNSVEQEEALVEIALAIETALAPRQDLPSPETGAKTRGDSAGGPRQAAATPKSGSSVLAGADPQAVAAARSGAAKPEMAKPEAAEPPPATIPLQRFSTSTCLLRKVGGRWRAVRRPLQVEGYQEEMGQGVALTMVKIPAGQFLMGSPEDEPERSAAEDPQHEVTLDAFFLAQTPITQAQWRAAALWQKVERDLNPDPSNFKGANRPVEQVSWFDALEFCRRLSQRTGRTYTLPSEAQWEYACRAESTTPFHFGGILTPDLANFNGTFPYGSDLKGTFRAQTTDVTSFPANDWGLQDMHGNVWEWCEDHWHGNYDFAPEDDQPWLIPAAGPDEGRLLRGGSWVALPGYCRSAYRINFHPDYRSFTIGFRVCCLPQD